MAKDDHKHDKHSQKEVLRSLGSGSHIVRDALRGTRGNPGQQQRSSRTTTPATSAATNNPPTSSALHRQPSTRTPATRTPTTRTPTTRTPSTTQRPGGTLKVERKSRWPKQHADNYITPGGAKGFICTVCSKSYVSMQYAREHVKNRHEKLLADRGGPSSRRQETFKCSKCDYVGLSQHGLKIHMGSKHKR